MRTLIYSLIIHLTLNILVFLKGWHAFEGKKAARFILSVVFGTELLVYSTGFIFYRNIPGYIIQFIFVMGSSWMLFLLYSGGLWLIVDIIWLIGKKQLGRPWLLKEQPQKVRIFSFLITVFIVSCIMTYGRYRFMHPVVQQIEVNVNKPTRELDSIRVAVIGDLHLGYMINRRHTKRFVDLIMVQQPDLILFTGDIIDSYIDPVLESRMDEELSRLSAPLGVFSCTGNHEYRYDAEEKIKLLNNSGIVILRDSAVLIDSAFYVLGREDQIVPDRKPLHIILNEQKVDTSKTVIVMNHTPDNLDEEVDAGADIAIYGHTHYGQAFPGNISTRIIFEVPHGYKRKRNTHIYVTSGIGLAGPQYRIGTVSEMIIMTVHFIRSR